MKRLALLLVLPAALGFGCEKKKDDAGSTAAPKATTPATAPAATPTPVAHGGSDAGAGAPAAAAGDMVSGVVTETMNSGGYTYVLVNGVWAAGPQTEMKVGDTVSFQKSMPMQNFKSNTLNRTFDVVYFVNAINKGAAPAGGAHGGAHGAAGGHASPGAGNSMIPPNGSGAATATVASADIKVAKAKGGQLVEEVFAKKAELGGKTVKLRGKVVKFNSGIMGKNWLHIQDGSGAQGTNDLTVTTDAMAKLGDTVIVEGTLVLDKDFGAGYKYDIIVENAKVTVE